MRFLKNLILWLLFLGLAMFAALHIILNRNGKEVVCQRLEQVFHRKVEVGWVGTRLPFDLVLRGVKIPGLFSVREVVVKQGLLCGFGNEFLLTELRLDGAEFSLNKQGNASERITFPRMMVKRLVVSGSTITYCESPEVLDATRVTVTDFFCRLENANFPLAPNLINFNLSGKIPWGRQDAAEGKISCEGWVNLAKKDIAAQLRVHDIDGLHFKPFFNGWIDFDKMNIGTARLNLDSDITGLDNNVTMDCHAELVEVKFNSRAEGEEVNKEEKVANVIFGLFKQTDQGRISLDFKVRTTLDSPEFGFGVVKRALDAKVTDVFNRSGRGTAPLAKVPAQIVSGAFKGAAELTRAVIGGTVSIGRGIKDSLGYSFHKREKAVNDEIEKVSEENSGAQPVPK